MENRQQIQTIQANFPDYFKASPKCDFEGHIDSTIWQKRFLDRPLKVKSILFLVTQEGLRKEWRSRFFLQMFISP